MRALKMVTAGGGHPAGPYGLGPTAADTSGVSPVLSIMGGAVLAIALGAVIVLVTRHALGSVCESPRAGTVAVLALMIGSVTSCAGVVWWAGVVAAAAWVVVFAAGWVYDRHESRQLAAAPVRVADGGDPS